MRNNEELKRSHANGFAEGDWMSIHHCELKEEQTSIGILPPMPDDEPTADLPF